MPCSGCGGARRQLVTSARRADIYGVANAVRQAARVNLEKMRGIYNDANYAGTTDRGQPVAKATPYRRPVERSS